MSNRKTYTIAQIGADFADAPFGTKLKSTDYMPSGVPVIQGRNIKNNRFEWNNSLYVSEEKFESLRRSHCHEGDLVFPKVGTIGITAIMPKVEDRKVFLLSTNMMKMSVRDDVADLRYVYYYFCQRHIRDQIRSTAGGSSQPIFNFTTLKSFEITLPPLEEQHRVAEILSAYDDLIENNTRRMSILEEMTQMIYREWFVSFRFHGHEKVKSVESDVGVIPTGWKPSIVSNLAKVSRESIAPEHFGEETFLHFSIPNFDQGGIPLPEKGKSIKSNKYIVVPGCILLSKLNPRIPRIWVPVVEGPFRAIASTEFLVLIPTIADSRNYLYHLLRSDEFQSEFTCLSLGTSTSHQRVKPSDFAQMPICLPPPHMLSRFSSVVEPLMRQIEALRNKSVILRETRDLLLPKLITGEIMVAQ